MTWGEMDETQRRHEVGRAGDNKNEVTAASDAHLQARAGGVPGSKALRVLCAHAQRGAVGTTEHNRAVQLFGEMRDVRMETAMLGIWGLMACLPETYDASGHVAALGCRVDNLWTFKKREVVRERW